MRPLRAALASTSAALLLACATQPRSGAADPLSAAPGPAAACAGAIPPGLAVPPGHELGFALRAEGVQIYACASGASGPAWTLKAPEARLLDPTGAPAGRHFAGPTWEASDGSQVVGAKVEGASPDPAAIPWLLLRAVSHAGAGRMADVALVQRVGTSGGLAPAGGCDPASGAAEARVPYTATYCFYRKAGAP